MLATKGRVKHVWRDILIRLWSTQLWHAPLATFRCCHQGNRRGRAVKSSILVFLVIILFRARWSFLGSEHHIDVAAVQIGAGGRAVTPSQSAISVLLILLLLLTRAGLVASRWASIICVGLLVLDLSRRIIICEVLGSYDAGRIGGLDHWLLQLGLLLDLGRTLNGQGVLFDQLLGLPLHLGCQLIWGEKLAFRLDMLAMGLLLPWTLIVGRIRCITIKMVYCGSVLNGWVGIVGDLATLLRLMLARGLCRAPTWLLIAAVVDHVGRVLLLQIEELGLEWLDLLVFLYDCLRLKLDLIEGLLLGVRCKFLHAIELVRKHGKSCEYDLL